MHAGIPQVKVHFFRSWTPFGGRDERLGFTKKRNDPQQMHSVWNLFSFKQAFSISNHVFTNMNESNKKTKVSVTEFHHFLPFHWGHFGESSGEGDRWLAMPFD
jgi:hypothetical protein